MFHPDLGQLVAWWPHCFLVVSRSGHINNLGPKLPALDWGAPTPRAPAGRPGPS